MELSRRHRRTSEQLARSGRQVQVDPEKALDALSEHGLREKLGKNPTFNGRAAILSRKVLQDDPEFFKDTYGITLDEARLLEKKMY